MTYENNYAWPGVTAIIYNVVLDLDFLGFYICCFCGIYINTQTHLIKDSTILKKHQLTVFECF